MQLRNVCRLLSVPFVQLVGQLPYLPITFPRICIVMMMSSSARVRWTADESEALRQAVKECLNERRDGVTVFGNLPWKEIAAKVQTKTNEQCRRHWSVDTFIIRPVSAPGRHIYRNRLLAVSCR